MTGARTTHARMEFDMPAADHVVFEAFHFHRWRVHWDSLVGDTSIEGDVAMNLQPDLSARSQDRA